MYFIFSNVFLIFRLLVFSVGRMHTVWECNVWFATHFRLSLPQLIKRCLTMDILLNAHPFQFCTVLRLSNFTKAIHFPDLLSS